jgi:hypothetical protein
MFVLLGSLNTWSQEVDSQREPGYEALSTRRDRASDLAGKNLERVAASTAQLQAVLLKDAGIMVELKRWVAKQASDNGQIVEDSELADQAIFDRLDRDVEFRSVTTRLVQRYGYLLPNLNPESDIAKEQDLVLKERARRFVQLEAQEDAAPPASRPRTTTKKTRTREQNAHPAIRETRIAICEISDEGSRCDSLRTKRRLPPSRDPTCCSKCRPPISCGACAWHRAVMSPDWGLRVLTAVSVWPRRARAGPLRVSVAARPRWAVWPAAV